MKITIELSSWFKRYTDGKVSIELAIDKGVTAAEAISAAGVPLAEVGLIMFENNKIDPEFVLSDNNIIKIFPFIIGG